MARYVDNDDAPMERVDSIGVSDPGHCGRVLSLRKTKYLEDMGSRTDEELGTWPDNRMEESADKNNGMDLEDTYKNRAKR
ncbi:hypothetical protein NDU88_004475 [Pleurodeles waltl]|uniref:Uncharacterized protein n=1 Tax=Pleurodeles waltl TaxID=8319 RepID=A0AAV7LR32_PLEWA|nr:hypothetical protein NDU88_004475 [Pleurodeles waltl]